MRILLDIILNWVAKMNNDRNFTVTEAADYLRVSRSFFYTLLAGGSIQGVKLGSRTIIPGSELHRFMVETASRQGNDDRKNSQQRSKS